MARVSRQSQRNNNNNPYATLRLCCTTLRTKEHSQLVGIISLSIFICLIVVSYSLFGVFAIAYIAGGIIIYGFMMESLLRRPNKVAILAYVAFEALQIAFYLSLSIYILIPLIYSSNVDWNCERRYSTPSSIDVDGRSEKYASEECHSRMALVELLIFLLFLITMKGYFTRVMLHLYKFYVWVDQHSNDVRAAYVNNRGVQINIEDNIFPPPPIWTPTGLYSTTLNPVPSYEEATSAQKTPVADENRPQQQTSEQPEEPQNRTT